MNCIVCGGDHQPSSSVCDSAGMDRQIAKLGAKRWNALTAHIAKINNKSVLQPLFSTNWEREDYERRQRGEPELGPMSASLPSKEG